MIAADDRLPMDDPLAIVRGILVALVIVAPFWTAAAALIWWLS